VILVSALQQLGHGNGAVVDSIYELANSISPGNGASNWDCEKVFQNASPVS
jgi:hypothetical protein